MFFRTSPVRVVHEDLTHTSYLCLYGDYMRRAWGRYVKQFISTGLYTGKVMHFLWNLIILLKRGWNVKTELRLPAAWKFHSERNK
jgi:hypothetical protein